MGDEGQKLFLIDSQKDKAKMPFRRDSLESKLELGKHTNDEMRKFAKEISSAKGYRNVSVRNQQAKRNLDQHEREIDVERHLVAQKLTIKRKELSQQLYALEVEKEKIALRKMGEKQVSHTSIKTPDVLSSDDDSDSDGGIVNPYPVALKTFTKMDSVEQLGSAYTRSRAGRRRKSREFEDLDINTSTGALLPRLRRTNLSGSFSSLGSKTPSYHNLPKDKEGDWMGHPEAISSVRRSRKTPEQLQRNSLLMKVSSAGKISSASKTTPPLPRKVDGSATSPVVKRRPPKMSSMHRENTTVSIEQSQIAKISDKTAQKITVLSSSRR